MAREVIVSVRPDIAEIMRDAPADGLGKLVNISCTVIARYSFSLPSSQAIMSESAIPRIGDSAHLWPAATGIDFTLYPAFDPAHLVSKK